MFGLSGIATQVVGGLAIIGALLLYNTWENFNIVRDTRAQVQTEMVEKARKILVERAKDNAAVSNLSDSELCAEFGGQWVSTDEGGECN